MSDAGWCHFMFSSRLHWNLQVNPITELLARKRSDGRDVLDLTESNPTKVGLHYPEREIAEALADERAASYDPSPAGLEFAREAVADYYQGRVGPECILLTTSTSEAYSYLFKLLTNPRDQILAPHPSYPLFEFLIRMELAEMVPYPLVYSDCWHIDFHNLGRNTNPRSRAIVVVNPNNPTGSYLKQKETERLFRYCEEHNLPIICDEVFAPYSFGEDAARVTSLVGNGRVLTFSLSGLSKLCGLPQMKLGWIAVTGPKVQCQSVMQRLELIADTYLSVGTPVQWALPKLLDLGRGVQSQIAERTASNLRTIRELLNGNPHFTLLTTEGGWYAVLRSHLIRTEEEWVLELLERKNVLIHPGYFYDFETGGYLVLSLLTRPEILKEGLARII